MAHRRQKALPGDELVLVVAALAAARQRRGMSQRELSRRLNLHEMTIMRLELGRRDLTLVEFVEIARAVGEEPWDLLREALDQQSRPVDEEYGTASLGTTNE